MQIDDLKSEILDLENSINLDGREVIKIEHQIKRLQTSLDSLTRKINAEELSLSKLYQNSWDSNITHQLTRNVRNSSRNALRQDTIKNQIDALIGEKSEVSNRIKKRMPVLSFLNKKLQKIEKREVANIAALAKNAGNRRGSHPPRRPVYSWDDAEELACDFMKWLGYYDAARTRSGADDGIDIDSKRAYAQVKAHLKQTPLADVQRHYGISVAENRMPVFFAMSYSKSAVQWSEKHIIALFVLDRSGDVVAINESAKLLTQIDRGKTKNAK